MNKPLFPDIVVNGTTLSVADIAAEAQNHHAPKGKPGVAWRKAARALAVRQLLLEAATARGAISEPQELAPGKFETRDDAQIRALLEDAVTPESVDETALHAAYENNPGAYRGPSLYQSAHILFAASPKDAAGRAAARTRAQAALETLRKSPARFAEIARSESDCESRDTGGELGQLSSGDTVPEFEAAMREMHAGQIKDEVVETRYGLHVLRLDARADGEILPFDTVRPRLREAAEKVAWTRAAQTYVAALLNDANITGLDLTTAA